MLRAYGNFFLDCPRITIIGCVHWLVGQSVGWLVGWLVSNAFYKNIKILHFLNSNMVLPSKSIILVVIHSLNHLFIHK